MSHPPSQGARRLGADYNVPYRPRRGSLSLVRGDVYVVPVQERPPRGQAPASCLPLALGVDDGAERLAYLLQLACSLDEIAGAEKAIAHLVSEFAYVGLQEDKPFFAA